MVAEEQERVFESRALRIQRETIDFGTDSRRGDRSAHGVGRDGEGVDKGRDRAHAADDLSEGSRRLYDARNGRRRLTQGSATQGCRAWRRHGFAIVPR